jgi:hypothetical protein
MSSIIAQTTDGAENIGTADGRDFPSETARDAPFGDDPVLPVRTSAAPCSALGCDHEDPELALITGTGTGGGTASGTDRQER